MAELDKLKVPELKAKCKELGLPVGGRKADLIAACIDRKPIFLLTDEWDFKRIQGRQATNNTSWTAVTPAAGSSSQVGNKNGKQTRPQPSFLDPQPPSLMKRNETTVTAKMGGMTTEDEDNPGSLTQLSENVSKTPISIPEFVGLRGFPPLSILKQRSEASQRERVFKPAAVSGVDVSQDIPASGLKRPASVSNSSLTQDDKPQTRKRRKVTLLIRGRTQDSTKVEKGKAPLSLLDNRSQAPWQTELPDDCDVFGDQIRYPPRMAQKKFVDRLASILVLTALREDNPAILLASTALVSKTWYRSSELAYAHLLQQQFPGERTTNYLHHVDPQIRSVRGYYVTRFKERNRNMVYLRQHWVSRFWEYLQHDTDSNHPLTGSFGGIAPHLLTNPNIHGEFEIAMSFWVNRFASCLHGMDSFESSHEVLDGMINEVVWTVEPIEGRQLFNLSFGDIWRLTTADRGVFFVARQTGEVLGWDEKSIMGLTVGDYITKDEQDLTGRKTWIKKMELFKAYSQRRLDQASNNNSKVGGSVSDEAQHLRPDWKHYVSSRLNGNCKTEIKGRLLDYVPTPGLGVTHPHHIHKNIVEPHRMALAERFVLAHANQGSFSGPELLPVKDKQPKSIMLDVDSKWSVQGCRCPGEKFEPRATSVLAPGVGYVWTEDGAGWWVLSDTGEIIAQDDYGIEGKWATLLGVDSTGSLLPADQLNDLKKYFAFDIQ